MPASPARRAAYEVVRQVRERGAYGPQVLDRTLGRLDLTAEDAAFATRLARGTLAAQGTLDDALDRFLAKPKGVEPAVRDAMRVSAYELLFARTPARAAVNEGVELVRRIRPQAAGMANAVLRRLAESANEFPWGDPESDPEALARATAHPLWLVRSIVGQRGMESARAILESGNEAAPLYLWHDPFLGTLDDAFARLKADGAEPVAGPLPGSIRALRPAAAVKGEAVASGLVIVTDAAAQFAPRALAPRPASVVVDVAAGRGTKTAELQALAVSAGGTARVFALDVHAFKSRLLAERMRALAVPEVTSLTGDATRPWDVEGLQGEASADAVLLDAPCTGTGTLRRHPEKRWRIGPDDVERLAGLQREMLASSGWLVRPGGLVVYSTCSILSRENEDVVREFLDSELGRSFSIRSVAPQVPEVWSAFVTPEGFFQSLPATDGPDGHFVAVLERR